MKIDFDFQSGKKTLIGVALFLVPLFATRLGYTIEADSISALMEQVFTISGSVVGLYGLAVKAIKGARAAFTKI